MICCACEDAKPNCEQTCPRWPGETKPERVYCLPWPKKAKGDEREMMKREEWL